MTSSRPAPEFTAGLAPSDAVDPRQGADLPISDYGLIGDMRGAALVSKAGAIDWLCLPKFDCTPNFFALLDADQGGSCRVTLAGERAGERARRYRPRTNILETTLVADAGRLTVVDFMPVRAKGHPGPTGADSDAPNWLVRRLRCEGGQVAVRLAVAPRFDWALDGSDRPPLDGKAAVYPRHGLFVVASEAPEVDGPDLAIEARLREGDSLDLVLGYGEAPSEPVGALVSRLLAETEDYWLGWAGQFTYASQHSDLLLRSALCLKLLTYAPTGALVAAPTTSLPEAVGGVRNWDYRFVWARDASFTAAAFINLGFDREAAEFLRFLHEADGADQTLSIMYGVDGDLPEERQLDHLRGWRGSRPVIAGNLAYKQDQFEIQGELLAALNLYLSTCGADRLCPSLRSDLPGFITRLAETVVACWRKPDHGIWEIRGPATHQVHTKALCWVALDRAVKLAPRVGMVPPPRWASERDAILAELLDKGWNAERNAYTMSYGSDQLDAAVLRLPLLQVVAADDPRMRATADAIDRELAVGDLYYRYHIDDGLPGREGAFAACAFWAVGVRVMSGRLEEAQALLDKAVARANDLGLFPEEFCVDTGLALGNYPQAFTHMAVIQETLRLSAALDACEADGG